MPVNPDAVVELRSREFSWAEVAHKLGCSVAAARRAARRATRAAARPTPPAAPSWQDPGRTGTAAGKGMATMIERLWQTADNPAADLRQQVAALRRLLEHATGGELAIGPGGQAMADIIASGGFVVGSAGRVFWWDRLAPGTLQEYQAALRTIDRIETEHAVDYVPEDHQEAEG